MHTEYELQRSYEASNEAKREAEEDAAQAAEDRASEIRYEVSRQLDGISIEDLDELIANRFDGATSSAAMALRDRAIWNIVRSARACDPRDRAEHLGNAVRAADDLYELIEGALLAERDGKGEQQSDGPDVYEDDEPRGFSFGPFVGLQ